MRSPNSSWGTSRVAVTPSPRMSSPTGSPCSSRSSMLWPRLHSARPAPPAVGAQTSLPPLARTLPRMPGTKTMTSSMRCLANEAPNPHHVPIVTFIFTPARRPVESRPARPITRYTTPHRQSDPSRPPKALETPEHAVATARQAARASARGAVILTQPSQPPST